MPMPLEIMTPADNEVRITRDFDAPRELVWDCHTKPELIRRWQFGFEGWSMSRCEMDLRAGGQYRYVLTGPNGEEMAWGGVYLEVRRPEFIAATERFDDNWTGGETRVSTGFEETRGRTTVTVTIIYPSKEARDGAIATGMTTGMEAGYQHLDTLLAEQTAT
jgi:uncharacterized protein YndB with AHSA1/START domain